ncbi:MAG: formylglycine-generating enzyme family protein [Spirochaetaceae bacterium]|jgi:formylglycine-generating enzyme required for sulfatase activity|nr:formylglycine-generating enzyme family protein [Spirochaetaceae bacterium]
MDPDFQNMVKSMVLRHGLGILSNGSKCRSALAEITKGAYQAEITLFLHTIESGCPKKIAAAGDSRSIRESLIHGLQEEYFILPPDAESVIALLGELLRKPDSAGAAGDGVSQAAETAADALVLVEGGTFLMGTARKEAYKRNDELPQHQVTVNDFLMGKYQVTQKEFRQIMKTNPSHFKGDDRPVEHISWYGAVEYCNKRSLQEGLTPAYQDSGGIIAFTLKADGYRLPTEAEWEYAAKGGSKATHVYLYAGSNDPAEVGWFKENSGDMTRSVGTKEPNTLGLFDLSGNVWEWCWDWYGEYSAQAQTNPVGPVSGDARIVRGGSWGSISRTLRSTERGRGDPGALSGSLGFRVVRSARPDK